MGRARRARRVSPRGVEHGGRLQSGVHAIGKKVVEEAAEAWMAAEHEGGPRRRGDRPAALPRAGPDGGLRPDPRRRLSATVTGCRRPTACSDRRPQQGLARGAGQRDAARGRLPAALRPARAGAAGPRQRHRVLLPATARHRGVRRVRTARRRHHRPRPAPGQRRAGRGDPAARLRAVDVPVRRPARCRLVDHRPRRAAGRDRRIPGWSRSTSPSRGHRRGDPAGRRGRDRGPAGRGRRHRRRRRDRHDAASGRPRDLRRADPGVRGGPRPPVGAPRHCRGGPARAPAAGRDRRAAPTC